MTASLQPSALHVADLPPPVRVWLLAQRYDYFVEKHEGPFAWENLVEPQPYEVPERDGGRRVVQPSAAEFVTLDGHDVLLPVGSDHHVNIKRERVVVSDDGRCLTLFLSDTTFHEGYGAGRFAFCEKAPDGDWYLCTVWHEWYPSR